MWDLFQAMMERAVVSIKFMFVFIGLFTYLFKGIFPLCREQTSYFNAKGKLKLKIDAALFLI